MSKPVTLSALEANPDREIPITDVAHMTGYNSQYLRRLEKSGLIPQSHKIGFIVRNGIQRGGIRAWFGHEVKKILDYQWKKAGETEKRMATLHKESLVARGKS